MVSIEDYKNYDKDFLNKIKYVKKPEKENKIMISTYIFLSNLEKKINKRIINLKKRKREDDSDDIIKIKCYKCNLDITRLYEKGELNTHCCYN